MKKTLSLKILTVVASALLIVCLATIRQAKAEWLNYYGLWVWCNVGTSCTGLAPDESYTYEGTCAVYAHFPRHF